MPGPCRCFHRTTKGKSDQREGVAARGLQEAGVRRQCPCTPDPQGPSVSLSEHRAKKSPNPYPPHPTPVLSFYAHGGGDPLRWAGAPGGPFHVTVPFCPLQGQQHTHGVYPEVLLGSIDFTFLGPLRGTCWDDLQSAGVLAAALSLRMGPLGCGAHPTGGHPSPSLLCWDCYCWSLSPPVYSSEKV